MNNGGGDNNIRNNPIQHNPDVAVGHTENNSADQSPFCPVSKMKTQ